MPTPATPGWKLPLAIGCFWPIFSVALTLSTLRNCGACRILDPASLKAACSNALGRVVAKSALPMRCSALSGTAVVVVAAVVVVVVDAALVLVGTWISLRGL